MSEVVFVSGEIEESPDHGVIFVGCSDKIVFELVEIKPSFLILIAFGNDSHQFIFFLHDGATPVFCS